MIGFFAGSTPQAPPAPIGIAGAGFLVGGDGFFVVVDFGAGLVVSGSVLCCSRGLVVYGPVVGACVCGLVGLVVGLVCGRVGLVVGLRVVRGGLVVFGGV